MNESNPTEPSLAQRISHWRRARGLNQKQLAELVGVTSASVSRWEQGQDNPTHERLKAIAKAVGAADESGRPRLDVFLGWLPPLDGEAA